MNPTDAIETYAREQQMRAWEIIRETRLMEIWQSIGAEVNLIGSLATGLLAKHRDIDFHVYTDTLEPEPGFRVLAALCANPAVILKTLISMYLNVWRNSLHAIRSWAENRFPFP